MAVFDSQDFQSRLFSGTSSFESLRDEVWAYQLAENPILSRYCKILNRKEPTWLPIEFFKEFPIKTGGDWAETLRFESSGTTGQTPSRHYVKDPDIYRESAIQGFFHFFPNRQYRILALLPSYLERQHASLVHMVQLWIQTFGTDGSGFYLDDFDALQDSIETGQHAGEQILLIGVSFALLDFAEYFSGSLSADAIVMETGGMKGRREELTRATLHQKLSTGLGIASIHSEYGMTELLSQAYSLKNGRFRCPPWMQVEVVDIHLPTLIQAPGISGRLLITDLSNVHSCAFIATDDIGRKYADGSFEVLGRLDHAEMRGCSLMYE